MELAKKIAVGSGVLIAVFLLVSHATDAGKLLTAGGNTYVAGVRALQGK
jgi:hypothetical protein